MPKAKTAKLQQVFEEFKSFALRGNVVDIAVGLTVGAAFSTIAKSFVNDILMPPVGLLLGGQDFSDLYIVLKGRDLVTKGMPLASAQEVGAVTLNYGVFINNLISFAIISAAFFLMIKGLNALKREEPVSESAPTTKICPFCQSEIAIAAVRCPMCTSDLAEETPARS